MRVLILSWRDIKHPLAGGAEQVMHEHAKGWIAAGHQVIHFSARFKGSSDMEEIDKVKIIRAGSGLLGVYWQGFLYYKKNEKDIDLIIDEFHGFPFFTPLYSKKPILAVIQETARAVWFLNPLPKPINWLVGLIGYLSEPIIFLLYKHSLLLRNKNVLFMTGSESAKLDVAKMGIPLKNITVVPHGVIIKKPTSMPAKENISTVTFLGILSKDKGIEEALRCFAFLKDKGQFQFWVIGRPETKAYGEEIKSLAHDLGLDSAIKFWGFVSQEEKFKLLARAHILVNPSIHEGWGLVNIEANSMGTPVVAFNSPGLVDSVKNGISGLICENNSPADLASKISFLLNDKNEYEKLRKEAKIWSQNFSWEKSTKISLQLLKKVGNND